MKQHCHYHPATPAHWSCQTCDKALCPECVEIREVSGSQQGQPIMMCPNCGLPLNWLGVANIIDPFWKRIPRFFTYPFNVRPLLLMLVLSLVATLLSLPGIVGLLTMIATWGVAFKYAYTILQSTAKGDLTAPRLDSQTLFDNIGPVVKQVGIYIAIFFSTGFAFAKLGMVMGVLVLSLAFLFLPAMIILLVNTESLIQAINPVMFITLAIRIGWGYLLMVVFYSILGGAPTLLGQHVIQYLPSLLQLFLFTLVKIYYTFISYHLMGYVILQYHENIGYRVEAEDFKAAEHRQPITATQDPDSRLLKRVHQMVKDGDHAGAVALIESETARQGITNPLLSERYYTLLKMTGTTTQALASHGLSHLDLLVHHGEKLAAMDVYLECLARDPNFAPVPGTLFKLGGWLNESGKSREAVSAFNRLTKAYPQDPLVPKSYFRAAQIFNDLLRNPEKAKKILNGLMKRYPDHDIIPFVKRYLGEMG